MRRTRNSSLVRVIASPSVALAMDALESIAFARGKAAKEDPLCELSELDEAHPYLLTRQSEPWVSSAVRSEGRKSSQSYSDVLVRFPKLFDPEEIRIREADLDIARLMTAGLDETRYAIGLPWPFAFHQLRRTGAANMLSTGLVSEGSLQYQLKHATRAMSRYYGQNYYRLHATLDEESRAVFVREMYESLAREFLGLSDENLVSPLGDKRKLQILAPIEAKDHHALVKAGRNGKLAYRETFLGGCANPGPPCPFGGISNVAACMGYGDESPCEWALLNRKRRPVIEELASVLRAKLLEAQPASPRHDALSAQVESAERALVALDA